MERIFYLLIGCGISFVMTTCGGGNSSRVEPLQSNSSAETQTSIASTDQYTTSTDQDTTTETPSMASSAAGTYEFSDRVSTWVLELNDDGSANIYNKKGNGSSKIYGSWEEWDYRGRQGIGLSFDDKQPQVWFPSEESILMYPQISDGYIYYDYRALKAKNPELRLSIKKLN